MELSLLWQVLPIETFNTLYMVLCSAIIASILGLPLGILLCVTDRGGLFPHRGYNAFFEWLVSIGRSFPFAILMIALIPVTRFIVGTSLGTEASIVPLSIAAAPFIARLFEDALKNVDRQTVEASLLMGATPLQIVLRVLLRESLPGLIQAFITTTVTLIGYSTMVGMIGGGGLGKVAIQYGYLRFDVVMMIATIILLILLVQLTQFLGARVKKSVLQRRGLSS